MQVGVRGEMDFDDAWSKALPKVMKSSELDRGGGCTIL